VIRFLVDQNFSEHLVDGLTRRDAALEFAHVRDVGLAAAPDPIILEWAGTHDLVLLTHDRQTIPPFAYSRVAAGLPMPGVFLVSDDMPIGHAIDELLIAVRCLSPEECKDIVTYFPL
jgi:predicted nuclease of predicted toxin-antitoxin system